MAKGFDHRRVGKIVGRHVHRLDCGHRCAGHRRDSLFEFGDLGGKRRLVADTRRQPPEHPRYLRARLHESEHVVHQEQNVAVSSRRENIRRSSARSCQRASARPAARSSARRRARCGSARPIRGARRAARGLRAIARRCPRTREMPEYFSTVLRISSMISTVLPTPAPPNIPALPPRASGARRSATLMPVRKTSRL